MKDKEYWKEEIRNDLKIKKCPNCGGEDLVQLSKKEGLFCNDCEEEFSDE